ncbi:MAG TPA: prepilin-type N-terminal cleavage/methylation domain-containing protein [Methylomicrobium sp.]|nr:prepilin-type N-terminal cleavage/methylation domain-containing protein [Methylomicrobium sp.]
MECKLKNNGFTLIEIMVSMVISSLVIAGVYGVYTIQQRSYTVQEQVSEMQQRIRAAVDFMSREMRVAGYDPPEPYDPGNACQGATITQADTTATQSNPQFFAFSYCDVTASSNTPPITYTSVMRTSRYQLENRVLGLQRDDDKSATAIAEGVDAIEFRYLGPIDPNTRKPTVLNAPVADRSMIRAVQISMLVRSTYPDPKYTNSTVYKPASVIEAEKKDEIVPDWDINGDTAGTGNPPNDNFHRRLLITTIYLRNMGVQQ